MKPSSLSPQPSPLIDERKIHEQSKVLQKREEPTGADNPDVYRKGQQRAGENSPGEKSTLKSCLKSNGKLEGNNRVIN